MKKSIEKWDIKAGATEVKNSSLFDWRSNSVFNINPQKEFIHHYLILKRKLKTNILLTLEQFIHCRNKSKWAECGQNNLGTLPVRYYWVIKKWEEQH
ncbi:MAG: hypothetical protein ABIO81_11795 [Ginsengibacter sp.]